MSPCFSVCLPIHKSVHLSVYLCVHLSVSPRVCLFVCMYVCLPVCLFICPYTSVSMSAPLSVFLRRSMCLPLCLFAIYIYIYTHVIIYIYNIYSTGCWSTYRSPVSCLWSIEGYLTPWVPVCPKIQRVGGEQRDPLHIDLSPCYTLALRIHKRPGHPGSQDVLSANGSLHFGRYSEACNGRVERFLCQV